MLNLFPKSWASRRAASMSGCTRSSISSRLLLPWERLRGSLITTGWVRLRATSAVTIVAARAGRAAPDDDAVAQASTEDGAPPSESRPRPPRLQQYRLICNLALRLYQPHDALCACASTTLRLCCADGWLASSPCGQHAMTSSVCRPKGTTCS